jgi:gas vesicle protein
MFNKKKPEDFQKKKRKGILERVVMGVIVGGAIGSVVGLAVAPKKGKETRDYLKEKGKEVGEKFMHEYGNELTAAKESTKKNGAKVWSYFKKKLLKRK